jgi:subtilisin
VKRLLIVLAALAATAGGAVGASGAARDDASPAGTTGYIVVLKDSVASVDAEVDQLMSSLGVQATYRYQFALKGFAASLTQGQADALRADPSVQFLSRDQVGSIVADGPIKAGETVPPGIQRIESAVGTKIKPKSSVAVEVNDTGVDLNQTDLNARSGVNCLNPNAPAQDDNGHGTHVAGIIAAKNQGDGVVGVSPNTKIYAAKWLNSSGNGTEAGAICSIDWTVQHAADLNIGVVNMSWRFFSGGDDGNCGNTNQDALHKAICTLTAAGVVVVAAAGNENNNYSAYRPASFDEVLTVTAMADTDGKPGGNGPAPSCISGNLDDKYASFSSFAGTTGTDLEHTVAAPGVCVLSTKLGGGTTTLSGTSMASPHVAGTVANCIGHKSGPGPCAGLTPAQVIDKIRADAEAKPKRYGFVGDPRHTPPAGRYYGYLVSNLSY